MSANEQAKYWGTDDPSDKSSSSANGADCGCSELNSSNAIGEQFSKMGLESDERCPGRDECNLCLAVPGFDPHQPEHRAKLQQVLPGLLGQHQSEQLLLFAGSGGVIQCNAAGSTHRLLPPAAVDATPGVSSIAAIWLPTIGHALMVEGSNLSAKPHPMLFSFACSGVLGVRLQLLKVESQGRVDRVLYAAPERLQGTSMTLRLCRGAAFAQTFRMDNALFAGITAEPAPLRYTEAQQETPFAADASPEPAGDAVSSDTKAPQMTATTTLPADDPTYCFQAVKIGAESGDVLLRMPGFDLTKPLELHPACEKLTSLSQHSPDKRWLLYLGGDTLLRCTSGRFDTVAPPTSVQQRPVVSIMAAIGIPDGERAILVEGTTLTTPSQPPALYCFRQACLAAEPLPLLKTASQAGKDRALFASPQRLEGEVLLLQLQRGGLFAQPFMMPTHLLRQDPSQLTSDDRARSSSPEVPPQEFDAPPQGPISQAGPPPAPQQPRPEAAGGDGRRQQQQSRTQNTPQTESSWRQKQQKLELQRRQSHTAGSTSGMSNELLNKDNRFRHHLKQWNVVGASQAGRENRS